MSTELSPLGEIEVRVEPRRAQGYPVKLFARDRLFAGYAPPSPPQLKGERADEDGKTLFAWLLHDDRLKSAWGELKGRYPEQRAVRLWIDEEAPELHVYPWELMMDGYSPVAASDDTPFSRFLMTDRAAPRPALRPVKVLLAVAAPYGLEEWGLSPIDVEEEIRNLEPLLNVPGFAEVTVLEQPCTLPKLDQILAEDFHILHLVAHGAFNAKAGESAIFLADDQNYYDLVKEAKFVGVFERHMSDAVFMHDRTLRLVYLSSCLQAHRSSADAYAGIGARLVQAGVPAVLAMQELVEIPVALQFAAEFYRNLLREGRVDFACNRARANVMARAQYGRSGARADTAETGLWRSAVPVLFMHRKDGWLWDRAGFTDNEGGVWNQLADQMKAGRYTLILGPDFNRVLIGSRSEIAYRWSQRYGFPLTPERQRDLPQVAQFLASNQYTAFPRQLLLEHIRSELAELYPQDVCDEAGQIDPEAPVDDLIVGAGLGRQKRNKYEPYHLVARLPVTVYMTVNPSSLLVESLREVGKEPMVAFAPWNDHARKLADCINESREGRSGFEDGIERRPVLRPLTLYRGGRPTVANPVVYFLFGHLCDAASIVLTEDDYFDYLISWAQGRETVDPAIRRLYVDSNLMFLGFRLEDWAFRILFRSIIQQEGSYLLSKENHRHVAAQVNPQLTEIASTEAAKRYLAHYFNEQRMSVYWGSVENFLTEMVHRIPES